MKRSLWALLLVLPLAAAAHTVQVGSKKFTEGVILAEIAAQTLQGAGIDAVHRRELGGSRILWSALLRGEIDVYPEYTGTLLQEILAAEGIVSVDALAARLAGAGIGMTGSLGFDDSYALGMGRERAAALGVSAISGLRNHPGLRLGVSSEFLERGDGWPGLRERYGLPQESPRGMDHEIAYRALARGELDVIDLYTTDAEIRQYDLRVLTDDLGYFPRYEVVLLYRLDLETRAPGAVAALGGLQGRISVDDMIGMNAAARGEGEPEAAIAARFLARATGIRQAAGHDSRARRIARTTRDHLVLVAVSLGAAIIVAIPLGVWAARSAAAARWVLGAAGILQTLPALALLVLLLPALGIGFAPAVVALFLYSLLPIVRNTCAGLHDIPAPVRESALALGLPPLARLRAVEFPLALRAVLAGIKTAAVINVGTATLGALVGAGGYGQPILSGIRRDDFGLILEGAVPAALLALAVQWLFDWLERRAVPRGLRFRPMR